MKRIPLLAVTFSTLLLAGSAFAQEGTARGGAASAMPSTPQNSPQTGQTVGPNAAPNYPASAQATTSGQAFGQAQLKSKPIKMKKAKKSHAMTR
jgi:hypothetical protein